MPLLNAAHDRAARKVLAWWVSAVTGSFGLPRTLRVVTVIASLALVSAVAIAPIAVSSASAEAPATPASPAVSQLHRVVTVPVAPATSFSGATSGDGWDVQFSGGRAFNVFHHNEQYQIDCHLQASGDPCDGVAGSSPWPKTASDASGADFATSSHASGRIDAVTGHLYGWATRKSDSTGGIVCTDLASTAANPFCGFTALTGVGQAPENSDGSGVAGNALVGTRMFALNTDTVAGAENQLLCFDTATAAGCPQQPFTLANFAGVRGSTQDWTTAVGGKVFVSSGSTLSCFDPATSSACGGWASPVRVRNASSTSQPFPAVDAAGAPEGICVPVTGTVPCWNLDGTVRATPAVLSSLVSGAYDWQSNLTFGSRVFMPDGINTIQCFDFATSQACPKFPITINNSFLVYTINPDPQRFGCLWTNADDGSSQIQTFDAFTGGACGSVVRVSSAVVIPSADCSADNWNSVTVARPARSTYDSATVSVSNSAGVPFSGASALSVDANGKFDLTGLDIGSSPVFGFTFTDPTARVSSMRFVFAWQSATAASSPCAVQLATELGDAGAFSVLAGAATTIPGSTIAGDVGAEAALTVTDTRIAGTLHTSADDATSAALSDLGNSYTALKALVPTGTLGGDDLGSMTILPGVYHRVAALAATTAVTFDAQGDPNARFVIQSDAALNTTAATVMILRGGAKASNIFWVTTGAATLGASSSFEGTIISNAAITLGAGTVLHGRALSVTAAVTLDANTISLGESRP